MEAKAIWLLKLIRTIVNKIVLNEETPPSRVKEIASRIREILIEEGINEN
jgi:hypothetical protein